VVRSLAQQGVDPRAVNVDWGYAAEPPGRTREKNDVKAELIVDRMLRRKILTRQKKTFTTSWSILPDIITNRLDAIRARLTKQGALDRMRAKLRSDKTLDWLAQNARIRTAAAAAESKPGLLQARPITITQMKNYEDPEYRARL